MRDEILRVLAEIRPELDFCSSTSFIEDGMLDSMDIAALTAALDKRYAISIQGTDIVPEHFKNIEAIAGLLQEYGVSI
jgi:D-alanine--poly(phosphoribitol) ligase subunit 2